MINEKRSTLKPILESKNGVHLTAYLVNRGDLIDIKSQLITVLNESHEWLDGVMPLDERKKFLEPLDSLLRDTRIFKQIKGNIGLFRNEDSFRVLNIPIAVEQSCQVATSFHVKPLLRWLQGDQEFLLLGVEKELAHLYCGSQTSFKRIDSILFPEKVRHTKLKDDENFSWLNDWISELTKHSQPKLFVAGDRKLVQALSRKLKYPNRIRTPILDSFGTQKALEACNMIRKILKEESRRLLERSLLEFRFAEDENRTRKNIFQIAKAVVQGKVRKLIVTDELNIFGKIDPLTGGLAIHPFDLDHEDDCILDDLAQMVLSKGGEVIIAKRDEIPNGRPVLAILGDEDVNIKELLRMDEGRAI